MQCVITSDPGIATSTCAIKTLFSFLRSFLTSKPMVEKAGSMDKFQITTLALNILSTDIIIRSTGIHILEMKPCILCKQKFISHPDGPIKEFTMATCGCLYHQKCLEGFLLNIAKRRAKLSCPNWDCK